MSFLEKLTNIFSSKINSRLLNKHSVKITWALSLLCLFLVLTSIIWTGWHQSTIKKTNYQAQNIQPITKSSGPVYRVSDIVAANLFGDPTPAPVVKKAPKTTLDLTLQGILWSSDNTIGRAIIKSGKKSSKLYSVGEKIKGAGASIEEIRDNEVILDRNGALESLALIKKTSSGNRQLITYNDPTPENYTPPAGSTSQNNQQLNNGEVNGPISRSTPKPRSRNGEPRKIRRPNFSGLDRALKKMGEL